MVKKIDLYGKQAERIYVEFSHERLATLGITPAAIAESLRSQNSVLAAGSIDTRTDRVAVRVTGQFTTEEDIRNVPITAGGKRSSLATSRPSGAATRTRPPTRCATTGSRC